MNSTSSIITIGREYGSGGRQIGQEIAKYFGIKCYDKELLEHAANDSGICKELLRIMMRSRQTVFCILWLWILTPLDILQQDFRICR